MSEITDRLMNILDDDPDFQDAPKPEVPQNAVQQEEEEEHQAQEQRTEVEDTEEETEDNPEEQAEEGEEEELQVTSLSELAEHLGAEVGDLYNLKIPVTSPDGTRQEVTIGEYKDSYRENEQIRSERARFTNEVETAQHKLIEKAQAIDTAMAQANAMMQIAEKQLMQEAEGLESLQTSDPAQYVLKKQQLTEKHQSIVQARYQAEQQYNMQAQKHQAEMQEQQTQYLERQRELLPQLIPEWDDNDVMEKERSEVSSYLIGFGVPQEQVQSITDASVVALARKAMLWDKQSKVKPDTKKNVVRIGKRVLTSGKPKPKAAKKVSRYKQDLSRAKKAAGSRGGDKELAKLFENYFLEDM